MRMCTNVYKINDSGKLLQSKSIDLKKNIPFYINDNKQT